MKKTIQTSILLLASLAASIAPSLSKNSLADEPKRIVLVAGKPSHPPRMHEFNAGVQLLSGCLNESGLPLKVDICLNGWPKDESILDQADAIVFYMDGGGGHEAVGESGRRLKKIDELAGKGVGIGCMHYAVEIVPDQAGKEFKKWIGGHYEHMFSCNPIWSPEFNQLPQHPITRGVKPFSVKDEWYFNMHLSTTFLVLAQLKAIVASSYRSWSPLPPTLSAMDLMCIHQDLIATFKPTRAGPKPCSGQSNVLTQDVVLDSPVVISMTTGETIRSAS